MLTIAFFLATGWPRTTGAASRSTGWTAYTVAVLNVVAVPLTHQATTQVGPGPSVARRTASDVHDERTHLSGTSWEFGSCLLPARNSVLHV